MLLGLCSRSAIGACKLRFRNWTQLTSWHVSGRWHRGVEKNQRSNAKIGIKVNELPTRGDENARTKRPGNGESESGGRRRASLSCPIQMHFACSGPKTFPLGGVATHANWPVLVGPAKTRLAGHHIYLFLSQFAYAEQQLIAPLFRLFASYPLRDY